jgi:DNA-binding NarL/FixJ family response regulator
VAATVSKQITVVIADDHPVFRSGLRAVLAADGRVSVVGEAETGVEAVEIIAATQPDMALLDLHMPGLTGVEAAAALQSLAPTTVVVMLSMTDDDAALQAAVRAGARGYLVKGARPSEIVGAVVAAAGGQLVFGNEVAAAVLRSLSSRPVATGVLATLTTREREVLAHVAQGRDNQDIGQLMHLSPGTVRNYVSACMTKLNASSRAQLVAAARDATN